MIRAETPGAPARDGTPTRVIGPEPLDELHRRTDARTTRSRTIEEHHDFGEHEAYAPAGVKAHVVAWIVGHVVEETARHLGHLDLIREALDGSRGY